DLQPVAPRRTLRFADQAETAAAVAAADGCQDPVALADDPAHRVVATQLGKIIGIGVTRGGAYLQMVARTVDAVDAGQLADRGVEQVECLLDLERHLDLPALPTGQRR